MRSYALALAFVIACGPSRGDDQEPTTHIEITPADLSVTIVDGAAVTQPYTATLVTKDGDRSDVTSKVSFSLMHPAFGNWSGPSLTITGAREVAIHCDGHHHHELYEGDCIVVQAAPYTVRLLHPKGYDYFAMLRQKLHWSASPLSPPIKGQMTGRAKPNRIAAAVRKK